jgi:electron transfer flavoprotein-quinone oxidoreductase
MEEEVVKVDCIVVGAGPAGLSAALVMAQKGLEVIVVERGETVGSKNLGGLLYGTTLQKLLPDFHKEAPVERAVARRRIAFLSEGKQISVDIGCDAWGQAPFNQTWTVHRSTFDPWFATKVEEAGASLVEGMVVDALIYEGDGDKKRAVGVKLRGDESFYADAIVLADGAHSLVSQGVQRELGLQGKSPQHFAVGVKETFSLPAKVIEDRFGVNEGEGAAIDFIGLPFKGIIGGGFIYTQKDTVSIGFAARVSSMVEAGAKTTEVMDNFRNHPEVKKYLRGGELLEYGAHMIPEGGIDCVPKLVGNGVCFVGDAAGLVNMSLYKEGTNHAMESGRQAALAIIAAKEAGDFSAQGLQSYETTLLSSATLADLKKYRELPKILEITPELLGLYPDKLCQMMVDYFTITDEPKVDLQKRAVKNFFKGLSKLSLVKNMIKARRLL